MKKVIKCIVIISERIRPILVKFVPINLLRKLKLLLIRRTTKDFEGFKVPPVSSAVGKRGVNLIGHIRGEIGLGQSCRLIAAELDNGNIPFSIYNYHQVSSIRSEDHSWDCKLSTELPYKVNLIHINPHEIPIAFTMLPVNLWKEHYNIAFWLWELEVFPEEWRSTLKLFNEIWTPSEFVSSSIRKITNLPVHTIPYFIEVTTDCNFDRSYFHLPENAFLFLCMYDCNSVAERKNPKGVIEAFKKAFSPHDTDMGIIIKINHPQGNDLELISTSLIGYPNVYLISDTKSKVEVNSLIQCADVVVSLHRAEGFGLVPAEAMWLGVPVISTNWSATTEFMNNETACLVDYEFTIIEKDLGPFKRGNRWANPDINQAAQFMRRLYEDKEYYNNISLNAKKQIKEKLSIENASLLIQKRLEEIYAEHT